LFYSHRQTIEVASADVTCSVSGPQFNSQRSIARLVAAKEWLAQ
jgi:hypothetical protein